MWICKCKPFWQEFDVESLILRWALMPVGILFHRLLKNNEYEFYQTYVYNIFSSIFIYKRALMCLSSVWRHAASVWTIQKKITEIYKDVRNIISKPDFKKYIALPNAEEAINTRIDDIKKSDSPIVLAGK